MTASGSEPTIWIIQDPREDGWSFETPDGAAYGSHSLEEAVSMARRMGFEDVRVEA